jgi:hypothetical protein
MTSDEFNEKYKVFIEPGFEDQGLEIDIPEVVSMLNDIFSELTLIPGFNYSQIKLKFNMARVYTSLKSSINTLIEHEIDSIVDYTK